MKSSHITQIQNTLKSRVAQYESGWFVTLDSRVADEQVTIDRLEYFANNELPLVTNAINKFCFGRSKKMLNITKSIEIGGKTHRLHAHMLLLHQNDCRRTTNEIEARLRKIARHVLKMNGINAIDVKEFDASRNWPEYFTKSTAYMHSRFNCFGNVE